MLVEFARLPPPLDRGRLVAEGVARRPRLPLDDIEETLALLEGDAHA